MGSLIYTETWADLEIEIWDHGNGAFQAHLYQYFGDDFRVVSSISTLKKSPIDLVNELRKYAFKAISLALLDNIGYGNYSFVKDALHFQQSNKKRN